MIKTFFAVIGVISVTIQSAKLWDAYVRGKYEKKYGHRTNDAA